MSPAPPARVRPMNQSSSMIVRFLRYAVVIQVMVRRRVDGAPTSIANIGKWIASIRPDSARFHFDELPMWTPSDRARRSLA